MYVCYFLVSLIQVHLSLAMDLFLFYSISIPERLFDFYPQPELASDPSKIICALLLHFFFFFLSSLGSYHCPIHAALDRHPRCSSLAPLCCYWDVIQLHPSHLGRYIYISKGASLGLHEMNNT